MEDTYRHIGLRRQLILSLQKKGIYNKAILKAMAKIPRHYFMDSAFIEHAYQDKPFSIGEGQTISQPYTVAFQTQLLEISAGDKILELGTGSGYQSSILIELGANLYTIERHKSLHLKAKRVLQYLRYNCQMILGDGTFGYKDAAPYNKILVTAGSPSIPNYLVEQLAIGAVMVIPVGDRETQKMLKITKINDRQIKKEEHGTFSFVKLIGKGGWKA